MDVLYVIRLGCASIIFPTAIVFSLFHLLCDIQRWWATHVLIEQSLLQGNFYFALSLYWTEYCCATMSTFFHPLSHRVIIAVSKRGAGEMDKLCFNLLMLSPSSTVREHQKACRWKPRQPKLTNHSFCPLPCCHGIFIATLDLACHTFFFKRCMLVTA